MASRSAKSFKDRGYPVAGVKSKNDRDCGAAAESEGPRIAFHITGILIIHIGGRERCTFTSCAEGIVLQKAILSL